MLKAEGMNRYAHTATKICMRQMRATIWWGGRRARGKECEWAQKKV